MARIQTGRRYQRRESTPRLASPRPRASPLRRTRPKTSAASWQNSPGPWTTDSGSGSEGFDQETADDSDTSMGCFSDQPLEFNFTASARQGQEIEKMKDLMTEAESEDGITEVADEDLLSEDDEPLYHGNTRPVGEWQSKVARCNDELLNKRNWSPQTSDGVDRAERYWVMFCTTVLNKEDRATFYQGMSAQVAYCFLDWKLCQRKNPKGMKIRRMEKRSSLITFWCQFRLAFRSGAKHSISRYIEHVQVQNTMADLCNRHGLSYDAKENRPMTIEDLKIHLDTILCTTERTFKLGEQRIMAILFMLLLAPAGSRPTSILEMRFGDLEIVLRRDGKDPKNGPKRLLIRMKLEFTKKYLGPKAVKTFHIPEIIEEPNFILNPHVFLLGILFRLQAFQAPGLNANPDLLHTINIHDDEAEIRLPIKKELHAVPVFRNVARGPLNWYMTDKRIGDGQIRYTILRAGRIAGFEGNTMCYNLRYMAGNGLDRNRSVSDSLRNHVMDHTAGSNTFEEHYINRNVCVDLWAVQRGLEAQEQIILGSTSHGYNRSSRRPIKLTKEQSASIRDDPKVKGMERKLKALPLSSAERTGVRRAIEARKAKLRREMDKRNREEWTDVQAVVDIERQLNGQGFAPAEPAGSPRPRGVRHERLIEALHVSLICDIATQRLRRTRAIQAIVDYCGVEELCVSPVVDKRRAPAPAQLQAEDPAGELRKTVLTSTEGERIHRCFICVGKAITQLGEIAQVAEYCRDYAGPQAVTRHFRNVHLSKLDAADETCCPICPGVELQDKKHLQRHAEDVHGIRTDERGFGLNRR